MKLKKIQKKVKKELDKERYTHTISVMYTAAALAMAHNEDVTKAMYAGLLHDCAKCIPNEKKLHICVKNFIEVTPAEQKNPFLLHAKLGAFLAKERYDITDPDILHAIRVHTTGAPGMNWLDKIIFIADYIEPHRNKVQKLDKIRKLAFTDLDLAMLTILSNTLDYLHQNQGDIDPLTSETYKYFKNSYKENFDDAIKRTSEKSLQSLGRKKGRRHTYH